MLQSFGGGENKVSTHDKKQIVDEFSNQIMYSKRYYDDQYEYRHVILPKQIAKFVPSNTLLTEDEWRSLGVTQSPGWVHYMIHNPEPHVLLFKRDKEFGLKYPSQN